MSESELCYLSAGQALARRAAETLAKTRRGTLCQNPAIKGRSRCKLHGGRSTGPRSPEGKARVAAANTKHGRRSRAHVEKVKAINAELRRITYEIKRDGLIP